MFSTAKTQIDWLYSKCRSHPESKIRAANLPLKMSDTSIILRPKIELDYKGIITVRQDVRFGSPCIVGTRISVYDVLGWLASGMSVDDILADYPQLSREQVLACLSYSADKERKIRISG